MLPIAIGRMPPSGLLRPIRLAPKKNGQAEIGTLPEITLLMKVVKEVIKLEESNPWVGEMRSLIQMLGKKTIMTPSRARREGVHCPGDLKG